MNYCFNSSFDGAGVNPAGVAGGWGLDPSVAGTPVLTRVPGRSGGRYAQRIQYTGLAGDTGSSYITLAAYSTPLDSFGPGDPLTASIYAQGSVIGCDADIWADWADIDGNWVGGSGAAIALPVSFGRFSKTLAVAPSGTRRAFMSVRAFNISEGDTVDITVDDAQMEKSATLTDYREDKRVLFYGDSLTYGLYALTESDEFVSMVGRWLLGEGYSTWARAAADGEPDNPNFVVNAASRHVLSRAPHICVIELGPHYSYIDPDQFEIDLHILADAAIAGNPGCRMVFLSVWSSITDGRGPLDAKVIAVARYYGASFVDISALMDDDANHGPAGISGVHGTSDTYHPNTAGHHALARAVILALSMPVGMAQTLARVAAVEAKTANLPLDPATDAKLDAVLLKTNTLGGAGAIAWPYTLTVNGMPCADAAVWITSDEAGNNVVASGRTDNFGALVPVPKLDAGTYYFFAKKSGVNFSSPDIEVVA